MRSKNWSKTALVSGEIIERFCFAIAKREIGREKA